MRVLLAEHRADGHRLDYVRILDDHLTASGHDVVLLLGPDVPSAPHFAAYLGDLDPARITVAPAGGAWLDALAATSRTLEVDGVAVPDGDHTLLQLGLRGRWDGRGRITGLVLRDPVRYASRSAAGRLRAAGKRVLLGRAARIPDVVALRLAGQVLPSGPGWVRDPVSFDPCPGGEAELRSRLGLDADLFWFGVFGRVQARKNLGLTADAMTRLGPGTGLLVAGICDADALDEAAPAIDRLRAAGTVVRIENRLLPARELDGLVRLVDCLVIAHSNEGPSGLLGKALAAGSRVVAAGARSLRPEAALSPAGVWSPLTPARLGAALERARSLPRPAPVPVADAASFADAFAAALRDAR
jgi:hypothetical protein